MMENQHRKISGYRELNQTEIDFMNEIKEKGKELDLLCEKVNEYNQAEAEAYGGDTDLIIKSEARKWLNDGKITLQKGLMFLTRSIAKPEFF